MLCSYSPLNRKDRRIHKVVIDAGHGGKDPGCLGKATMEKDVAHAVAYEVGSLIKALDGVQVVYTRLQNDEFVPLEERARIANKENADLFISVHANASPSPHIHGTETYVMGLNSSEENLDVALRENASILQETDYRKRYNGFDPNAPGSHILMANYQSAYLANSLRMAQYVEHHFTKNTNRQSRGVKQSGFLVLWKTAMPSVLIETGFLTNEAEEKFLSGDAGKTKIASSIYRAFRDYKYNIERH